MNKRQIVSVLFALCAMEAVAEEDLRNIIVASQADSNGLEVVLCWTPLDRPSEICTIVRKYVTRSDRVSLQVSDLCQEVPVSAGHQWYISRGAEPRRFLYRIDCETERARNLESPSSSAPSPASKLPASSGDSQLSKPDAQGNIGTGKQGNPEKLNKRLDKLEQDLKEQKSAVKSLQDRLKQHTTENQDLEKKLKTLKDDVLKQLKAIEDAQKNSCIRSNDTYQGRDEVTIAVAGGVLRFLKVEPQDSAITIGLADARADELLAKAQAQSGKPIVPHIYLAVPEAVREVKAFFLQDRLIDPQLYSRLTGGKDANRVAYQDVSRFIDELNTRCAGRAAFVLPSEEQFVAAAHELYNPVESGLTSCEELRKQNRSSDITELFGYSWQLTRSLCQPLGERARFTCPDNSYVRKGGAASSTNPLECLPEYRSPAPLDVQQKETSFRLALVD